MSKELDKIIESAKISGSEQYLRFDLFKELVYCREVSSLSPNAPQTGGGLVHKAVYDGITFISTSEEELRKSGHLTLNVVYTENTREFKISGDVKEATRASLLEAYIHGEVIGAGVDRREAYKRDVYHITLEWYPEDDRFVVKSDTGNRGLTDGILLAVLRDIES